MTSICLMHLELLNDSIKLLDLALKNSDVSLNQVTLIYSRSLNCLKGQLTGS